MPAASGYSKCDSSQRRNSPRPDLTVNTACTLGIQLSDNSVDAALMRAIDRMPDTPRVAVNASTAPNDRTSLVAIFKS